MRRNKKIPLFSCQLMLSRRALTRTVSITALMLILILVIVAMNSFYSVGAGQVTFISEDTTESLSNSCSYTITGIGVATGYLIVVQVNYVLSGATPSLTSISISDSAGDSFTASNLNSNQALWYGDYVYAISSTSGTISITATCSEHVGTTIGGTTLHVFILSSNAGYIVASSNTDCGSCASGSIIFGSTTIGLNGVQLFSLDTTSGTSCPCSGGTVSDANSQFQTNSGSCAYGCAMGYAQTTTQQDAYISATWSGGSPSVLSAFFVQVLPRQQNGLTTITGTTSFTTTTCTTISGNVFCGTTTETSTFTSTSDNTYFTTSTITTTTTTSLYAVNAPNPATASYWIFGILALFLPVGLLDGFLVAKGGYSIVGGSESIIFMTLLGLLLGSILGLLMAILPIYIPVIIGVMFALYLWRGRG